MTHCHVHKPPLHSYLLLAAIRPLFRNDANPLVSEHANAEDGDSPSINELERFHSQHRSDDIIRVVLPPRNCHESIPGATNKDESTWSQKAEQPGARVLEVRHGRTVRLQGRDLEGVVGQPSQSPILTRSRCTVDADFPDFVGLANIRWTLHFHDYDDTWGSDIFVSFNRGRDEKSRSLLPGAT